MNRRLTLILVALWICGATYYIYVKAASRSNNRSIPSVNAPGEATSTKSEQSKHKVADEKRIRDLHKSLIEGKSEQERELAASTLLVELDALDKSAITTDIRKDLIKLLPTVNKDIDASMLLSLFTIKGDEMAIPLLIEPAIVEAP